MTDGAINAAEVVLACRTLDGTLQFFTDRLGFRIDAIFPADDPAMAQLSGHGLRLRLERGTSDDDSTLRLLCSEPDTVGGGAQAMTAPNGTRIEIAPAERPIDRPIPRQSLAVNRSGAATAWGTGRAGMQYRDLVPDRQGGHLVASHIRIPGSGAVADYVHFHQIGFQAIYCYRGWARLVYEDQGPPFLFEAGDCVLQPPRIRHRVLESGDDLEVIEVGSPARHMTCVDHDLALPTGAIRPERVFAGQRFVHHRAEGAAWAAWRLAGFEARDTGIAAASAGIGTVRVVRPAGDPEPRPAMHDADTVLLFVLRGDLTIEAGDPHVLATGDSILLPSHLPYRLAACSTDLEVLEVAMPAGFATTLHPHATSPAAPSRKRTTGPGDQPRAQ